MTQPFVSFAVTTNDEGEYIQRLFSQLIPYCKTRNAEIVVLDDKKWVNFPENTWSVATRKAFDMLDGTFHSTMTRRKFDGDFAEHKNYLNSLCRGKYIFQIDADETLDTNLLLNLEELLEGSEGVDLFLIPRVNTVEGLTEEDIRRWGWQVNERGWVMFPDYQTRLYRNDPNIKWVGKVHERIQGFKTFSMLPAEEDWSIHHPKTIDRQRKQNDFYNQIQG